MQIDEIARAKINLCLHVTGLTPQGYHQLDSIVVFADYGDRLHISPSQTFSLTTQGPFAASLTNPDDNLITTAAKQLKGDQGAQIVLEKNLPVASGIGGGSADAGAALRGLSFLWSKPLAGNFSTIGADVPVCIRSKTCRMRGTGQDLTDLETLPKLPCVLVNPNIALSTVQVFDATVQKENEPIHEVPTDDLSVQDAIIWLSKQRNDLQSAAIKLVPEISNVLTELEKSGAKLARMSGSGATCFGLFETREQAQRAALKIANAQPNYWVQPCTLGD